MSRPSIERMQRLVAELQRGCTLGEVATRLEVTQKTIRRDIEFMNDRLGYRIAYNYATTTWEVVAPKERVL